MDLKLGFKDRNFLLVKIGKHRTAMRNVEMDKMASYKVKAMQKLMKQCRQKNPSRVWFYDDNWENIRQSEEAGFNAVWVDPDTGLEPKQIEVPKMSKGDLALFDFDHTFATVNFGRACQVLLYNGDIDKVINSCLGGKKRLSKLRRKFTLLEKKGVRIGFVTYNTSHPIKTLLRKIGWIK